MSVRVGDRNASRIEFLYQADKLHEAILDLTFREFGIYSRNAPFRKKYLYLLNNKTESEIRAFISKYCNRLEYLSDNLILSLNNANSIYPRTKIEYEVRSKYILDVLSNLTSIRITLNSIAKYFNTDINLFKNTIEILNKETELIKRLKMSDRKRFGQLL